MAKESSGAARSSKDKQRSAYLKAHGIHRATGKCCICYATVRLVAFEAHYGMHARGAA